MGIKNLMKLILKFAPDAVRKVPLDNYSSRVIACDASMAIYQFLIATQFTFKDGPGNLQDNDGNPTAHLIGIFNRTI
jgi:flap endonuclease-1